MNEFAIIVNSSDNVAVVKKAIPPGTVVSLDDGGSLTVNSAITVGNRFATRPIPAGEFVRQYGQPIGTSLGIAEGDMISHVNMSDEVPIVRTLPDNLRTPAPDYFPIDACSTFLGFRRPDGRVGTRNFILVVPTSMCSSHEAQQIATISEFTIYNREKYPNVDGIVAIPHNKGCGCPDGSNVEVLLRVLSNYAAHPNVGGVVLLELGCEKTNLSVVES
jgi:altronate hydrolase